MNRLANPFAPRRALPESTRQIKAWVRELHYLDDEVVVSITELACRDDDCPDIETVIGIMRPGKKIETIPIHRAIAEILREDVAGAIKRRERAVPD
ncbi:nitrate reductase [Mesorhizobium sp. AaZ16]|uniref:nitrate reductase n=1 Tax=Mesorhizobium sp. AaZ16 TaxID=3402289 RepID=UPI00374E5690